MKRIIWLSLLCSWMILGWSILQHKHHQCIDRAASTTASSEQTSVLVAATPQAAQAIRPRSAAHLTRAGSLPVPPTSARSLDEIAEDEAIFAESDRPEPRIWRAAWANERHDEQWTRQTYEDVGAKARALLKGELKMHDLSCRESVCRMYLKFADQPDAQAFITAPQDSALQVGYQRLDPQFVGDGYPKSDYEYEVLIKRPEGAAPRVISEIASDAMEVTPTHEPQELLRADDHAYKLASPDEEVVIHAGRSR